MVAPEAKSAIVEPPRGFYPARVDEKGRLKIPAAFTQYLEKLGETSVFITSLDLRIARLYPISVWKQNEIFFEGFSKDPEKARRVFFMASDLGADSELDGQGRVLIPQELRRMLKLENQQVYVGHYKGVIDVYSKDIYEEERARSLADYVENARDLLKEGMK